MNLWRDFKQNLAYYFHYASTLSAWAWSLILAVWGGMDKASQIELVGSFLPTWAVTAALFVMAVASHAATKGWPQPDLDRKLGTGQ